MAIKKITESEAAGTGLGQEHGPALERINDAIQTSNDFILDADGSGFPHTKSNEIELSAGELSFDDLTRTLAIQPAPSLASFKFYSNGVEYEYASPKTVQIPNAHGSILAYFDAQGVLRAGTSFATAAANALVAYVYWDATNERSILFADERHGYVMPHATHMHLHFSQAAAYYNGMDVQSISTDEDGNLPSSIQFGVSSGQIADEDILFTHPSQPSPANLSIYYRLGESGLWHEKTPDAFPLIYNGTAGYAGTNPPRNYHNGTQWALEEISTNDYFVMLYFATNDASRPVVGVQAQNVYNTLNEARNGILTELNNLARDGMPFLEFVACYGMICQANSSYSNVTKARFRTLEDGNNYLDLRKFRGGIVII